MAKPRGLASSGFADSIPHDVEARFRVKRATTWTGYKVHLTETCEENLPNLITHVATTDATVPDTELLTAIHAHLAERDLLPAEQQVDAGSIDAAILVTAATVREVDVVGPVRADTNWQARQGQGFAAECFKIDWEAKSVTCPQDKRSTSWKERVDHLGHDVIDIADRVGSTASAVPCAAPVLRRRKVHGL